MSELLARLRAAWDQAEAGLRNTLAELHARIGAVELVQLAHEALEVARTLSAEDAERTVRALVMRKARAFRIELSPSEGEAIARFLLHTEG